jgi:tRNA threonylcarbamoyladenosine biosynthesis protein TsaE
VSGALRLELGCRGDTRRLGRFIAGNLLAGDLLLLEGDLGAGKTFLARAIARGLGVPSEVRVTSPTFDLIHELPGRLPLLHADLYRLDDPDSLGDLGLLERLGSDAVVLIEWGERFGELLGDGLVLRIQMGEGSRRVCQLLARGARGEALLGRLQALGLGAGPIPRLAALGQLW